MKPPAYPAARNKHFAPAFLHGALIAATLFCAKSYGQESGPLQFEPGQSLVQSSTVKSTLNDDLAPITGETRPERPLLWGPFELIPHANYRYAYENGILALPGHVINSSEQDFSPGLGLKLGTHVNFDYTPTWSFYTSRELHDTTAHRAILTDETHYENLDLKLSQTYDRSSMPLVETGTQTAEEDYATTINASVDLNGSWALDSTLSQSVSLPRGFASTREWVITEGLNYQIEPGLSAAATLGYGYASVDPGPNMTFFRPEAQVHWRVVQKIVLVAHAGYEDRRFLSGRSSHLQNPIFGLSAEYKPTATTRISLGADRVVAATFFADQVVQDHRWSINVGQQLFQHLDLGLGYEHLSSSYIASVNTSSTNRTDESDSFNCRLGTTLKRRITVAAVFQSIHNSSNLGGFSFTRKEIGIELGYRY